MGGRTSSKFCSQCGDSVSPDDAFCANCGTRVGTASGASTSSGVGTSGVGPSTTVGPSSGSSSSRTGFRRRVEDLTVEGWDVKHDYGDRVVMVDRQFGSWGIHALLLVFTGGLANIPYAWYNYSPGADRLELRADGTERYLDERDDSSGPDWGMAATLTFSFFSALVGLVILSDGAGTLPGLFMGLTFLGAALYALPPVRGRLSDRESVTTFGRARSTDEEVVTEPKTPCTVCSRPVGTGVKRTFRERRYVAGIPVETLEEGENYYCRTCANGEPFIGEYATDGTLDGDSDELERDTV